MNYTITIHQDDFDFLRSTIFSKIGQEGAAFVLCGESKTENEFRFLGREVVPVSDDQYLVRSSDYLSLASSSYVNVAKRAKEENLSIIFVHSHPGGFLQYSKQDDQEELKLQKFFKKRIPARTHGSLILTNTDVLGRVFACGFKPMSRIRILGRRFLFHDRMKTKIDNPQFFDRQIHAFGVGIQKLLQNLHIGIVGAGGTGSAVIEQLSRLGVGELSIFDGDVFDSSNVNRLFGSSTSDQGRPKVDIAERQVKWIGLNTRLSVFSDDITKELIAKQLKTCDIIFGCTDKETPRAILTQLSLNYLIPIIDMGIAIKSNNSFITDVVGRVTTFFPGEACLFCRRRITAEKIRLESLPESELDSLVKEGYVAELQMTNPAVIPFTCGTASLAIVEFLHRLTGFMGSTRDSSELLCFFDQTQLRTNRLEPRQDCVCSEKSFWGKGDVIPFLDNYWAA